MTRRETPDEMENQPPLDRIRSTAAEIATLLQRLVSEIGYQYTT
jgi:hypothetical protein